MGLKAKIYNSLVSRLKESTFPQVSYNPETKAQDYGPQVEPVFSFNELRTSWSETTHRRISYIVERIEWQWELNLEFPVEVDAEEFERNLSESPIGILEEDRQYYILLNRAEYTHPPRQLASNGSRIKYTFVVRKIGA